MPNKGCRSKEPRSFRPVFFSKTCYSFFMDSRENLEELATEARRLGGRL